MKTLNHLFAPSLLPATLVPELAPSRQRTATNHPPKGLQPSQSTPRSVADWMSAITKAFARGTGRILQLARLVSGARAGLKRGQWTEMWRPGRPFAKSKANMLATIGVVLGGLNGQNSGQLPAAWNTLYFVARLGRANVEALIGQGRIHTALTLAQAKALLAEFKPETVQKTAGSALERRLARFARFVRQNVTNWSLQEKEFFQLQLRVWHELVGTRSSAPPTSTPTDSVGTRGIGSRPVGTASPTSASLN